MREFEIIILHLCSQGSYLHVMYRAKSFQGATVELLESVIGHVPMINKEKKNTVKNTYKISSE